MWMTNEILGIVGKMTELRADILAYKRPEIQTT